MKIDKIRISNVLGIEHLEFDAGRFNAIEGRNGSGKTTVLEAIRSVIEGGSDATLLRHGQEKGEVVLLLDDGVEIRKRVGGTASVTVEKDGVRSPSPQSVIKALTDSISVNPVAFLQMGSTAAGKKQRVNVLLEAMPISVSQERLTEIAGEAVKVADPDRPGLEQIEAIYKAIYDDRTYTNRAAKEKEGTINQLSATLPEEDAAAPSGNLAELEAKLLEVDQDKDAEVERITKKLDEYRQQHGERMTALRAELAAIQEKIAGEERWMVETAGKAGNSRSAALTKHAETRAPIVAQINSLRDGASAAARAVQTRETIKGMREEVRALESDSERQSKALEALTAYKSELLASLPIPGLEVKEGEIYRSGVAFDRLNKAQQVEIAVEIAKLRAGKLGIICVDELESLDAEHLEHFKEAALKADVQLFVTRVADHDLTVNSTN